MPGVCPNFARLRKGLSWKANTEAAVRTDHSYSSSSDSVPRSPVTIFTGGNTLAEAFNNNKHS